MSGSNPEVVVKSGVVDTHCHLFLMDQEPAVAVEAARAAGVDRLICVGVDVETSERSIQIAGELEGVFASAGVHPHDADGFDDDAAARVEALLKEPAVIGVGECGLDWFRMHSERDAQIATLHAHVRLANAVGKPMIVHVRDAWDDALRVLDEGSAERVVIHCFTGDADVARECARRGYWLSFAGNVTYPKNGHMREAAAVVPLDHPRGDRQPVPRAAASAWRRQCAAERPAHACRACKCARGAPRTACRSHQRERRTGLPRPCLTANGRSASRLQ